MSRKLGETLVEAGSITEAQLHRALTAQLVFGGHVGTSLLELGYLDEETLGETLSRIFAVPYTDFETLSKVPYSVVRSLPARLVEKHKVVPLKLDGKTLHLAMIDPKNLLALDEISFVTGYRLVPSVSPEIRVLQVLEKYYNLPRTQRYTTLARELSRLRTRRERLRPLQTEEIFLDREARPVRGTARMEAAAVSANPVATVSAPTGADPLTDHWEKYGYGRSWRDVAEGIDDAPAATETKSEEIDTRPQPATSMPAALPIRKTPSLPSVMEVTRRLAEAESVDEIVATTLSYVGDRLHRSIFFVVKGDQALGWAGQGDGLTEPLVKSLALSLRDEASIFSMVADGQTHYLGSLPPARAAGPLYRELGVGAPRTVLVMPITVKGRVTAYLYCDGGGQEILSLDLPAVLSLCSRAGFALQIIILRNKILAG